MHPIIPIAGKDYKLNLPGKHLSFSQVSLYLECPEKYRASYVDKEPRVLSAAMVQGTALGQALNWSNQHWIKTQKHKTLKQIQAYYIRNWTKLAKTVDEWGNDTKATVQELGLMFLEQTEFALMVPVAVEEEVRMKIAGVPMLGYIDMREKRRITDFKVASTARYYKPESSLQLGFYAIATGTRQVRFRVYEKKKKTITDLDAILDLDQTRKILEFTVSNVAKAISLGSFPPCDTSKNPFCCEQWCGHWNKCIGAM